MDVAWVTYALIFFIIALLFVYATYMSSQHGVFKKMGIPGPSPLPILGTFFQEIRKGPFKTQQENYHKYTDSKVFGVYSGRDPVLMIRDMDMIREITVKHFSNFVNRRVFQMNDPLDHMLTMIKDDHWKNVRTIVSPTFSTGKLRRMYRHISRSAMALVDHLKEARARGEAVELKHVVSCFSMDVIASTGFGVEINSIKDAENDFVTKGKKIMDSVGKMVMVTLLLPFMDRHWDQVGINVFPKEPSLFFSRFVDEALKSRKDVTNGASKRHDFLQLLMEAEKEDETENDNMSSEEAKELKTSSGRKPLSHSDIQGQAILFMLAGYDTVSTVMSFTLFLLAHNHQSCTRLQQEIDEKLGKRMPTYDNIQELTYMDMCLNEAMRLYPPGFQIDRVCNEDVDICGIHIPKGMIVAFPVFSIHRDPAIWPDPMTFDPDRFSHENKTGRHPYAHLPFGQGPRNCIGMRLALLEIKVALAAILQEMTPVVCSKTVFPVRLKFFQMTSEDGLWVKMAERAS